MQNWIIYLSSVIVLGLIVGLIYFHEESDNDQFLGFLVISAAIILWPLTLCMVPIAFTISALKRKHDNAFHGVKERVSFKTDDNYENNYAIASAASTPDLKLLLRGARFGKVQLKSNQIEIIKRELLNRAAENGLLK